MLEFPPGILTNGGEKRLDMGEVPGIDSIGNVTCLGASSVTTGTRSGLTLSSSGRTIRRSYSVDTARDVESCSEESGTGSPDEDQQGTRSGCLDGHDLGASGSSHLARSSTEGSDPDKRMRRQIANCNERRRMQSINAGFQQLKNLVRPRDTEKLSKAAILQHAVDYIHQLQEQKSCLAQMLEFFGGKVPSQQQQQQVASDPSKAFGAVGVQTASVDLMKMVEKIGAETAANEFPSNVAISAFIDTTEQKQIVPPPAKRRRTENSSSSTSSASSEDGCSDMIVGSQNSVEDSTSGCRPATNGSGSRSGIAVATFDGCVLLAEKVKPDVGPDCSRLQTGPAWASRGNDVIKKEFIETEIVFPPPYLSADAVVPTVDDIRMMSEDAATKNACGAEEPAAVPPVVSATTPSSSSYVPPWHCPSTMSQRNLETIIEAIRFLEGEPAGAPGKGEWGVAERRLSSIVETACMAQLADSSSRDASNRRWSPSPRRSSHVVMQAVRSS